MPRRNRPERRPIAPDPRFNSVALQQFINKVMMNGKKGTAERIVYGAMEHLQERTRQDPLDVFQQAMRNVTPQMGGSSPAASAAPPIRSPSRSAPTAAPPSPSAGSSRPPAPAAAAPCRNGSPRS